MEGDWPPCQGITQDVPELFRGSRTPAEFLVQLEPTLGRCCKLILCMDEKSKGKEPETMPDLIDLNDEGDDGLQLQNFLEPLREYFASAIERPAGAVVASGREGTRVKASPGKGVYGDVMVPSEAHGGKREKRPSGLQTTAERLGQALLENEMTKVLAEIYISIPQYCPNAMLEWGLAICAERLRNAPQLPAGEDAAQRLSEQEFCAFVSMVRTQLTRPDCTPTIWLKPSKA